MERVDGRREVSWCRGGWGGAHLHSGSAVEREGFDLPVLQENLQHIGNEEESFFLQHVLAHGASNRGREEDEGHRETEGGWRERMSVSDGAVTVSSTSQGLRAKRNISPENPAFLLSRREAQRWSGSELLADSPPQLPAAGTEHPTPSSTSQSHTRAWQPVPLPSGCSRGDAMAGVAQS